MISAIIILGCFIAVIIFILTEKLNRAVVALAGALVTYFTLIWFEDLDFTVIVQLLFGTEEDGFVNLHSLILIIAMMIIVSICAEAGLFQFLALKLILLSKGKPLRLLVLMCLITVLISSVINNILTVIILIPLTVTISRILNIDPSPYILTQAILVNIGGTMFTISSIPNILIISSAKISFIDFFLNVGIISLIVFGCTLVFFMGLYKDELVIPSEGFEVLKEFDAWSFIPNKALLYDTTIALVTLLTLFIVIPASLINPSIIALSIAVILIIISNLNSKEIIDKINMELILYLLGIFIIAGAFELVGIVGLIAGFFNLLGGSSLYTQILVILWFSALLSSSIDNIPITKVLIPVIGNMTQGESVAIKNQAYYALAIGANWGDNLTPLGDNVLVVNLAEQNKRPIGFRQFFKLGFFTTIYQLLIVTLIFTLIFYLSWGLIIILIILLCCTISYLLLKKGPASIQLKIKNLINRSRNLIIK